MGFVNIFFKADFMVQLFTVLLIALSVWIWKLAIDQWLQIKEEEALAREIMAKFEQTNKLDWVNNAEDCMLKKALEMFQSINMDGESRAASVLGKEVSDVKAGMWLFRAVKKNAHLLGLMVGIWVAVNLANAGVMDLRSIFIQAFFVFAIGIKVRVMTSVLQQLLLSKLCCLHNQLKGCVLYVADCLDSVSK